MNLEKPQLTLGFIPLTDCAPLVVAREKGFFERYGLDVALSKETSWANIRDKLAIGVLDGAQLLAPMVVASHLGLGPVDRPVVTSLSLDLNGNAITLSEALFQRLRELDPEAMRQQPVSAEPLRRLIEADRAAGRPPLTFATVFPYSSHNYALRYWMAAAGIDPDNDVQLIVIPPPQMVSRLRQGAVDGYCVGEPWNAVAVQEGLGRVVATGWDIWRNGPEKVLGVNQEWAEQYPETHLALVSAVLDAARWLDQPANRLEVVELISQSRYVNAPPDVVRMSMMGTFQYAYNEFPRSRPDFNVFHRYAANFPWRSHALWFLTQMLRWGQIAQAVDLLEVASAAYRPEVYREAAQRLGVAAPARDYKVEGEHPDNWDLAVNHERLVMGADRLFDGRVFDPADPVGFLQGFDVAHLRVELNELIARNPRWSAGERAARLVGGLPADVAGL